MADIIINDGPGYGLGLRFVGPNDPGGEGPYQQWLEIPPAPAVPVLHVRNDTNTGWLVAGGSGLAPEAAFIFASTAALPAGSAHVIWDAANWTDRAGNALADPTAQLAGMGLSYDAATGVFTVLAGGDGVYALRVDTQAAAVATVHFATVAIQGTGGYAHLDGAVAYVPAGSIASFYAGIALTDTFVAGDQFYVSVAQTAAETDLSWAALGIVKVR